MPPCRLSPGCGPTSLNGGGRSAAGTSSSSTALEKYCVPAAWEGGEGRHHPERGREVLLAPPPGPGRLLAQWDAVVSKLGWGHRDGHPLVAMPLAGKLGWGHRDGHPLVAMPLAEPSLSPAAGTACAAACIIACNVHRPRGLNKNGNAKRATQTLLSVVGSWLLVVGCWLLVVGCWLLVVVGCWLLVLVVGWLCCWLLVVGCWLLVVGCWLLVVGCWLVG